MSDPRNSDLGFEADLFKAADRLRGNLEPSEYKHVVLGLVFLKYISEAFEAHHARLAKDDYADPEDPEEYLAENIFWVPKEARWSHLRNEARDPNIGKTIDDAMEAIERVPANEKLRGVLPKNYARPTLNKEMLGDLIDLFSKIDMRGDAAEARDLLGRVYEYFLSGFASSEGKRGGSSLRPDPSSGRWFPCWGRNRAGFMIPAAARAVCLFSPRISLRTMAAAVMIFRSTGRRSTTRHGGWR